MNGNNPNQNPKGGFNNPNANNPQKPNQGQGGQQGGHQKPGQQPGQNPGKPEQKQGQASNGSSEKKNGWCASHKGPKGKCSCE